ncbi:MAG TPA: prepilin-type N-terminal cleavage/methylation domain-containing protein [Rhodoblastus sp.]|nr:prepilin-type N-terminal cleavage/methylation domain-containing protein [Rhodoblastus sp.]
MSRATPPDHGPRAGFTLLETLVALALLAAVMAAIGSLASVGRRANRAEIERVGLAQVARRVLAELTERNFSGGTTGGADGYAWRVDVQPMAAPPPREAGPSPAADQQSSPFGQQTQPVERQAVWIPYRVILRISGPGGVSAEIVTVRLGKAAS